MKTALVGVTGYGGMVLYQLLQQHPAVTEINLYGHSQTTDQLLSEAVPMFGISATAMIHPYDVATIMAANDVVFFATSAGVTSQVAAPFIAAGFPVIDLSGDYRLKQPATYEKWYHKPAAPQAALDAAYYGLAEFGQVGSAKYVANPGCYATATLLGLAPLAQNDLIQPDSIVVDAKSGTSGAGKKLATSTHFSQTNENLQLYKVDQHQHIPEIMQQLQAWNPEIPAIEFTTTLIPVTRGIMSTIYAKVKPGTTAEQLVAAFETTYQHADFVRFGATLPMLKQVQGTNFCDLGLQYNPVTHNVTVVSVIDNLIKGAGGQAIQNLNQMFGLDAAAGLPTHVIMP
jgi:N-acetyl-gamma-glutamyl-phosphate reductase